MASAVTGGEPPQQLEQIVALVGAELGPGVVGAYLYGSAVMGGLRPRSDIDVFVVVARANTLDERRRVIAGLLELSPAGDGRPGLRPVELTVVVQSDVCPWRSPPRLDLRYGEWWRGEHESGLEPWPAQDPDLASLITMLLLANRPLIGPPAAEVLDPVPEGDFIAAIVSGIEGLLSDLEPDTCNVLLTLARIWCTAATGAVRSKDAAAEWALARLPADARAALSHARAIYLGDARDVWGAFTPQVVREARLMVGEITRLSPAAPA